MVAESKLGTAVVPIKAKLDELKKGFAEAKDEAEKAADGIGSKFSSALKVGMLGAAGAVVGLGALALKVGSEFDEAYDTIRAGTGATGEALKGLQDDFKAVVKDIPTDFGVAGQVLADLNTRTGQTGQSLQALSKNILEMSRITKTDANSNVAAATRLFGDWSVATEDQAATLDEVFRASQSTGIGVDSLMQKVVQFGAPLRNMGFSLEDSMAMLGKWEKEGVNSELVLGSLRIAAGKFANAGVPLKKGLQDTIKEIKNMTDSSAALALGMEVFGARAGPDMTAAIREGRFEYEDYVNAIENGGDTILGVARETEDAGEKWKRTMNRMKVAMEPVAMKAMDLANVAMDAIGVAIETLMPLIISLAGWLGDRLGPVVKRVGDVWRNNLEPALRGVWAFIDKNVLPILKTLWEEGLKNIGDAAQTVARFWNNDLKPALEKVWDFISVHLVPALKTLWEEGLKKVDDAARALADLWNGTLKTALETIGNYINITVIPAVKDLAEGFKDKLDSATTTVVDAWNNDLKPALEGVGNYIKDTLRGIFETETNTTLPNYEKATRNTAAAVRNPLFVALNELGGYIAITLKPLFETMTTGTLPTFGLSAKTAVADVNPLFTVLNEVGDFIQNSLGPLVDAFAGVKLAFLSKQAEFNAGVWERLTLPALQTLGGYLRDSFMGLLDGLSQKWQRLQSDMQTIANFLSSVLGSAFSSFGTDKVSGLTKLLDGLRTMIGWVTDRLHNLRDLINSFQLPDWLRPSAGPQAGPNRFVGPPARATGGPVWPGQSFLVGERGPEPFVPSVPGFIYPTTTLAGLSGQGGMVGGLTLSGPLVGSITVTNEADEDRLVAKMADMLQTALHGDLRVAFAQGARV